MFKRICNLLICVAFAFGALAQAQQRLEIIPLQHRLAEQVMPTLQPLIESGGSISAASGKIIVRASARNIQQIRQVLAAIDTPARRLQITVSQGGASSQEINDIGVRSGTVTIGSDGNVSGSARGSVYSNSGQRSGQSTQRVQTIEGGDASIFVGRSIALPMRQVAVGRDGVVVSETVRYVDVGSGFVARPDVVGDRVTITISPQNARITGDNTIAGSRLSTTVSGRLGEWIALGGSTQQRESRDSGATQWSSRQGGETAELMLKVDVLE